MNKADRRTQLEPLLAIAFIAALAALAYLPLVSQLGIYRDAWQIIRTAHSLGVGTIPQLFSTDRPLVGWMYRFLYQLQGDHLLAWQLITFVFHLASALGLLWVLRTLWPEQRRATTLMAALFAIYPGFLQMPDAITYQIDALLMTAAMFSIALSLQVDRIHNRALKVLSVAVAALVGVGCLFTVEYYVGLEGLRFCLLWYQRYREQRGEKFLPRTRHALVRFLPYLALTLIFLVWRLFIFKSIRPTTNMRLLAGRFATSPLSVLLQIGSGWLKDLFNVTIGGWVVPAYTLATQSSLTVFGLGLLCGALGIGLSVALMLWPGRTRPAAGGGGPAPSDGWGREAIWLGLVAVLVISLPTALAGRSVSFTASMTAGWDRYALLPSLGAVILVGGLLSLLNQAGWRRAVALLLVGTAIATHFQNAAAFRDSWANTRDFFWQLSWRAPQLEPGTVLLTVPLPPSTLSESYHIGYPASLIYYGGDVVPQITSQVLNPDTVQGVVMQIRDTDWHRTIGAPRDYSKTLVAYIPAPGACLHLVDGRAPVLSPGTSPLIAEVAAYSHLDRIQTGAAPHDPPIGIFGAEPRHAWCYFYQKASLAAQRGDWQAVAQLSASADSQKLFPGDPLEAWPFVLGDVHTGNGRAALALLASIRGVPYLRYQLCTSLGQRSTGLGADLSEDQWSFLSTSLCG